MRSLILKSVLFVVIFSLCVYSFAQFNYEPVTLVMAETGAYSIIERSDWLRYNNGRYVGLVRHEVRASILPMPVEGHTEEPNKAFLYNGNFFVLQNTLRDMRQSAQPVDAMIPVSFELQENGVVIIENDQGYPILRGFPTFPAQKVTPGLKWQAPGSRAADPLNLGNPLIVPFVSEYEYRGVEQYQGTWVHRIYATYPVSYRNSAYAINGYARIQGSHKVDILIRLENGLPIFMRDYIDETYTMADGSTMQLRGFTLTFGAGIIPMDRKWVITSLGNTLNITKLPDPDVIVVVPPPPPPVVPQTPIPPVSEAEDRVAVPPPVINPDGLQDSAIDLTPVPEGIRLTIRNILFVADSAEFLPAERPRLDLIAEALKQIPDRTFLVEGHTAATGRPAGEMELSIERAQRMVDELVRRGINADRFIFKGWGGTRPVGDNSTNEGRSANRRVEITILE
jgi:outer membrane protein OmpA-like peptidoglycan-associated protein